MKYTKEQLQAMSDFEVNATLAELLGLNVLHDAEPLHSETSAVYHNGCTAEEYNGTNIDYCNTPNDIMPMAFEYAIGVEVNPIRTEWLARTCDISMSSMSFICYIDKNPLRAITCCLILVLQGEKE